MLAALEKSLGIVSSACKKVKIARQTHYEWLREDADYKAAVQEIDEMALDFVESKLYKQIASDNPTAIIFHLKTKGKSRGYVERMEHTGENSSPIAITVIRRAKPE